MASIWGNESVWVAVLPPLTNPLLMTITGRGKTTLTDFRLVSMARVCGERWLDGRRPLLRRKVSTGGRGHSDWSGGPVQ